MTDRSILSHGLATNSAKFQTPPAGGLLLSPSSPRTKVGIFHGFDLQLTRVRPSTQGRARGSRTRARTPRPPGPPPAPPSSPAGARCLLHEPRASTCRGPGLSRVSRAGSSRRPAEEGLSGLLPGASRSLSRERTFPGPPTRTPSRCAPLPNPQQPRLFRDAGQTHPRF